MFGHEEYDEVIRSTFNEVLQLGKLKGGEYSGDYDRLANFRRNGMQLGLPMEVIWGVYSAKHWDAIMQYINDLTNHKTRERLEPLEGRVNDLIVYLLLFKCMLIEHKKPIPTTE